MAVVSALSKQKLAISCGSFAYAHSRTISLSKRDRVDYAVLGTRRSHGHDVSCPQVNDLRTTPPSEGGDTPRPYAFPKNPMSLFTSRDDVVQIIIREMVCHQT